MMIIFFLRLCRRSCPLGCDLTKLCIALRSLSQRRFLLVFFWIVAIGHMSNPSLGTFQCPYSYHGHRHPRSLLRTPTAPCYNCQCLSPSCEVGIFTSSINHNFPFYVFKCLTENTHMNDKVEANGE